MFPLDLMPAPLFHAAHYLPFYYQMYFPAAIITGRIGLPLALEGLAIQFVWVLVLLAVNQLLWVRGLRRHTAVGG
jgi:ABC-2 type transport system permease protein